MATSPATTRLSATPSAPERSTLHLPVRASQVPDRYRDPPPEARARWYAPEKCVLVVCSNKNLTTEVSKLPPRSWEETWTIKKWREWLRDDGVKEGVDKVIVENRALLICLKNGITLDDQLVRSTATFASNGNVEFEHSVPVSERKIFCVCPLKEAALEDGTNPKPVVGKRKAKAKAPITIKKDGNRLLNIMEKWVEGHAWTTYEPEDKNMSCKACGLCILIDITCVYDKCKKLVYDLPSDDEEEEKDNDPPDKSTSSDDLRTPAPHLVKFYEALARYLHTIPANTTQYFAPRTFFNLWDGNDTYEELCESLASQGFKFRPRQMAQEVLKSFPNEAKRLEAKLEATQQSTYLPGAPGAIPQVNGSSASPINGSGASPINGSSKTKEEEDKAKAEKKAREAKRKKQNERAKRKDKTKPAE